MSRLLLSARGERRLLAFDAATGAVEDAGEPQGTATGVFYAQGDVGIALYAEAGELVLQIGAERFALARPSVQVAYAHDFAAGQTTFRVADGERHLEVRYPAWWSEIGLSAEDVRFRPEDDEYEDYLAFVAEVAASPERRRSLAARWK